MDCFIHSKEQTQQFFLNIYTVLKTLVTKNVLSAFIATPGLQLGGKGLAFFQKCGLYWK